MNQITKVNLLRIHTTLVILGGMLALINQFSINPHTKQLRMLLGSTAGTVVILILFLNLFLISLFITLIIISFINPNSVESAIERSLSKFDSKPKYYLILNLLIFVTFFIGQAVVESFFLEIHIQPMLLDFLRSTGIWIGFIFLQFMILIIIAGKKYGVIKLDRDAVLVCGFFVLILVLNSVFGFGYELTSLSGGHFRPAGYPILDYQVIIVIGLVLFFLLIRKWLNAEDSKNWLRRGFLIDIGLISVIILSAYLLWSSAPIENNGFIDIPRPPNHEIYPALDSVIYDRSAQELLAGGQYQSFITENPIQKEVVRRPVLVLLLAALHKISGYGYLDILPLQLVIFTMLPALIYLLVKDIHSREAGLLSAGLIIYRQYNALLLGGDVTGTNMHMLMSDIYTTIGVVLFLYLLTTWFKKPDKAELIALIAGGVLGLVILIRSEIAAILFAATLAGWVVIKERFRLLLKSQFYLYLGVLLIIMPWIGRNYIVTGNIYLDMPGNRVDRLFSTFKQEPQSELGLNGNLLDAEQNDPRTSLQLGRLSPLLNHTTNSFIQSVIYLPSDPVLIDLGFIYRALAQDLETTYGGFFYPPETVKERVPYWRIDWDGRVHPRSFILLIVNLGLIAWGFSTIRKLNGRIAIIFVLAIFAHIGINVLARQSGSRYLLEVDWMFSMFYSIGVIEWIYLFNKGQTESSLSRRVEKNNQSFFLIEKSGKNKYILLLASAVILFVGVFIPLIEVFLPNQYPDEKKEEHLEYLLNDVNSPLTQMEEDQLAAFLEMDGASAVYGRALYPNYYETGQQVVSTKIKYFDNSLTFYIAGEEVIYAVLPVTEPPDYFPHGSEIIAIGCKNTTFDQVEGQICLHCDNSGFDTLAVFVHTNEVKEWEIIWKAEIQDKVLSCPLSWPTGQ